MVASEWRKCERRACKTEEVSEEKEDDVYKIWTCVFGVWQRFVQRLGTLHCEGIDWDLRL